MNLKNGYKVMYEVINDNSRVIKASKTGCFEDADPITTITKNYKAVYQRGTDVIGKLADGTEEKIDFDAVLKEASPEDIPAPTNLDPQPTPSGDEPDAPNEPQDQPDDGEV